MPMIDSPFIERLEYLSGSRRLMVTFRASGVSFIYFDVELRDYQAFLAADSKEHHYYAYINGRYNFVAAG